MPEQFLQITSSFLFKWRNQIQPNVANRITLELITEITVLPHSALSDISAATEDKILSSQMGHGVALHTVHPPTRKDGFKLASCLPIDQLSSQSNSTQLSEE